VAADARILTARDMQASISRFGAPEQFHYLLLAAFQAAFANRIAEDLEHYRVLEDPRRVALPMSHLEVLGTINSLKSDPDLFSQIKKASLGRGGRALIRLSPRAAIALRRLSRLGRFALDEMG